MFEEGKGEGRGEWRDGRRGRKVRQKFEVKEGRKKGGREERR